MARPFALQANTILSFKKPIAELRGSTFFFVFINIHFSFVDVKARFHLYINQTPSQIPMQELLKKSKSFQRYILGTVKEI